MSDQAAILLACAFGVLVALWDMWRRRPEPEEIACAAIKYDDIGALFLPAPARHHHIIWARLMIDGVPTHSNGIQGFLTTRGRFVDRKEGLRIAEARDQIEIKHPSFNELYSEDMWPDTPPAARNYKIVKVGEDA